MQLVVLAGGLGTRLRGAIPAGVPKPMASIGGRPFLEHLLDNALAQGVTQTHLLVGYAAEKITGHFGSGYRGMSLTYSHEDAPLGTGGALKAAREQLSDEFVLCNGDTFADVGYDRLLRLLDGNVLSMGLARMSDAARFGTAITDHDVVVGFHEKWTTRSALVNAGVYACRRSIVEMLPVKAPSSFETDFLEPRLPSLRPRFVVADSGFIDIGTPESLAMANSVFGS